MADPKIEGYAGYYRGGLRILLPSTVASELEREEAHKANARAEAAAAAGKAAAKMEGHETEEPPAEAATESTRPAPGYYRVLHRLAHQTASTGDDRSLAIRTSDPDVQRRYRLLGERLLKLGPDRRIGRAPNWRAALDALEQAMPNFEGPIRMVRHTLAMGETTGVPVRLPPMLLLGPPGVGKTLFSQSLAELLAVPHACVGYDSPRAGNTLLGSDAHWANSQAGLLFELLCLGEVANPVVLLDEVDKASVDSSHALDPLAQLHSVLEPQTSRRLQDLSTGMEFDASLVGYLATANTLWGMGPPLLSRFEVFEIRMPDRDQSVAVARRVIETTLSRLGADGRVSFERRCAYVLARMTPRLMRNAVERLAAAALHDGRREVSEEQVWEEMGFREEPRLH